jgi:transposase
MKYVGIDLHKQTISLCVVDQSRNVLARRRLLCADEVGIREYFRGLGRFRAVVEATAGYEWLMRLLEPLAERAVLAHPKRLRIIAESTRKSDRVDAQLLAEFLALDQIPEAYLPTPRQRGHRRLVRHRDRVQRRIRSLKNRLRRILADHNADVSWLFSRRGLSYLATLPLDAEDRFVAEETRAEFHFQRERLLTAERRLVEFAAAASDRERRQRELLRSIPGVGFVTNEIVLAELADVDRFRSQKQVVSYAGLAPGHRESAGKRRDLGIEKCGSALLRWALVEAAWQLVRRTDHWRAQYLRLKDRVRSRKAIVAIARRLLCAMVAVLKENRRAALVRDVVRWVGRS